MEKENKVMQDLLKKALSTLQMTLDELEKLSEPKQPFKDGDVVESKNGNAIIKITDLNNLKGYGLNNGIWDIKDCWSFKNYPHDWQLSTPEKWLGVCTKEAERLYKVGDKIKPIWNAPNEHWIFSEFGKSEIQENVFYYFIVILFKTVNKHARVNICFFSCKQEKKKNNKK
jgi:hypothetical protein